MNPVEFQAVTFGYEDRPVFRDLSVDLAPGVTSLTGPNGVGKSTFLLLASGRYKPQAGRVLLEGRDTADLDDLEQARACSLVYQNMEFENEEPLGELLAFVEAQGFGADPSGQARREVIAAFGLEALLHRKTQTLAKGEMQRAVMAFSLLYGSRVVAMDEPVFALEDDRKRRSLGFLRDWSRSRGVSFLYSAHELDLTRDFADQVLLFGRDGQMVLGTPDEVLTRDRLEAAYGTPYALLHQKERLHREVLLRMPTPREAWEAQNQGEKTQ